MSRSNMAGCYFEWMYKMVCEDDSHRRLLNHLHNISFRYSLPMDGNRAADGVDLRYRFAYDQGLPQSLIVSTIDDKPCSVLEMLIALSLRCEEQIMHDESLGDRTGVWFWLMLENLYPGIEQQTDRDFRARTVDEVVNRFMDREYTRDGKGNLFYIPGCREDLRNVEIWCQLNWYLSRII